MNNIFEKNSLALTLLKIFDIYLCLYFATYKKIDLTQLWHAIEPQTIYHLIVNDKVAEQHILGKYSNCNSFGVTMDVFNSQELLLSYAMCNRSETLPCDSLPKTR